MFLDTHVISLGIFLRYSLRRNAYDEKKYWMRGEGNR